MPDPTDLDAIEARCKAATHLIGADTDDAPCFETDDDGIVTIKYLTCDDAHFIANSRQDVELLCREVRALRQRVAELEGR